MANREDLKNKLIMYSENNWIIPKEENAYELVNDMIDYIGDTDPYLRDKLIYTGLYRIIITHELITPQQCRDLVYRCLDEKYLFDGINEISDKVFKRCFVVLLLDLSLFVSIKNDMFSKEEFIGIYKEIMRYIKLEKDFRGYDIEKGWAHTTAHSADVLATIVESKHLQRDELLEVLSEIKRRATIDYYAYINDEDERQVNIVENIYKRKLISDDEFINWINSFNNYEKDKATPAKYIEHINRKTFLRSLYFRFINGGYNKELENTVTPILIDIEKWC